MERQRKRAIFYLALIFLCGAVTGTVAENVWMKTPWSVTASADSSHSIQNRVEKFTRELHLTPEQAKLLNQILDESHNAYQEYEAKQDEIREQGRARIREILTPEQRPKYEQLLARIEARRRREDRKSVV